MQSKFLEQVGHIEDALVKLRRELGSLETDTAFHLGSGTRPSISLSSNGKIANGDHGLEIEYRGSNDCPYGKSATRDRRNFSAIMVHHTSPKHTTDWYIQYQIDGDSARGGHFGYHFYIYPNGKIIQGAPLTKRTNHIKPSRHKKRRDFGRFANNTNAIGITCGGAGKPDFRPTQQQLSSLRDLAFALCNSFKIEFTKIYGHGEVQTDRHPTEGQTAAEEMRNWSVTADSASNISGIFDDDLDDSPIFEIESAIQSDLDDHSGKNLSNPDQYSPIYEDSDDEEQQAISGATKTTDINYVNQNAIRNKACTQNIERRLVEAIEATYGHGCSINIYSGGQDQKGVGARRTGSVRHDDFGEGGRAADVHIFDQNGKQIKGLQLAKLGQYWLASHFGGVGHEMNGGGIHLDEWTTPPAGGGMFWTYNYSQSLPWGNQARQMLEDGAGGVFP